MNCLVCDSPDAEPHYGGVSCRACAAFFRRYWHSKKTVVSPCVCSLRLRNSHPCRECRLKKCLEAGMEWEKIQVKREKHVPRETPTISPQIPSRSTSTISQTTENWQKIEEKHSFLHRKMLDETDYYEMTCNLRTDVLMMWHIVEALFPAIQRLSSLDRKALLRNFLPKWSVWTAVIDFEANVEKYKKVETEEEYRRMIVDFYAISMRNERKMTEIEILSTFEPILRFYGCQIIVPLWEKRFDSAEFMALTLIALFDGAYTNISVECSEMCHNIRKHVFRELKSYQIEKNCDELRFLDTIDTLNLIEKGERKFQEELLICEMHNVHLHEDLRQLLKEQNV